MGDFVNASLLVFTFSAASTGKKLSAKYQANAIRF